MKNLFVEASLYMNRKAFSLMIICEQCQHVLLTLDPVVDGHSCLVHMENRGKFICVVLRENSTSCSWYYKNKFLVL